MWVGKGSWVFGFLVELLTESQATLQSQKSEAQQANKKRAMLGEPTEVRFLYKNLRKKKITPSWDREEQ